MPEGEIAARAAALRLPITELADLAGLNKHTVYNAVHGRRDCLSSTRDRLLDALRREEQRVLEHLIGLKGGTLPGSAPQ